LKILIINHFPLEGSGSGVYTNNLATQLSKRGHKVKVIFPENKKVITKDFESRQVIFKNGNKDYEVPFNFPCFTTHPRSNNTFYNLTDKEMMEYIDKIVIVTKEVANEFEPDIIHAQHLWIAPYAAYMSKRKYVVTVHGTDLMGFEKDERYHKYALIGAKNADRIITISKQVTDDTKRLYGLSDDKIKLVLNGYNNNLFKKIPIDRKKILKEYGIEKDYEYIVSFAGKLTHFKGVDVLLKAAKIYNKSLNGRVVTLIVGNGELYGELSNLKKKLNLTGVNFLGHVPQEKLVEIFNIADVNIVPSRVEPFGLVALEALACGTPVIGTSQGGLLDFINDDIGKLVEVEDDIELAYSILNELQREDKKERSIMASKYAYDNFSIDNYAVEMEKIYKESL